MKSSNITPVEMQGCFTDDKTSVFSRHDFQWKVDLIYINRNKGECL